MNAHQQAPQQRRDSANASQKPAIGVIGVGWVGLVSAACFAELGHPVVAVDIDEQKIETLRAGGSLPIHEPGLDELVERNRERLTFTTDIAEVLGAARLLFCCVDTPPTYSGDADLSRVEAVVAELPEGGEHALVMKSTVPAGTGAAIRRSKPGLVYVSCPEFLKEGSAVTDFLHPDRVVIGADPGSEWAADEVAVAYTPLGGEIGRTDVPSAEMIKLASNAFLATKISFINEIANVCEGVGADVNEVARGMGLDSRIGPQFLQAGIGYGGSCFDGSETVLIRLRGWPRLISLADLWDLVEGDAVAVEGAAVEPEDLSVWSWVPGEKAPEWTPVSVLTKQRYEGDMITVHTKMGRRVRVTGDHPFIVGDGVDDQVASVVLARDLQNSHWVPVASGLVPGSHPEKYSVMSVIEDGHVDAADVHVRPERRELDEFGLRSASERAAALAHPRGYQRWHDISRSGSLRLREAAAAEMDLVGAQLGTARNGTLVPADLKIDADFWHVVGLYLAEGCVSSDRGSRGSTRKRIIWSFHPSGEEHLVTKVVDYWKSQGVKTSVRSTATSRRVEISSRVLSEWWEWAIGLGSGAYEQRIPGLLWEQTLDRKIALLSGLWEGDGSWSLVNGGPSVILEWGTVSAELADGVARLLGELGLVCSWRRGRTEKSTQETHWLRVSGADQIERALFLVPERQQMQVLDLIAGQAKRIAPTGYRRWNGGMPWVRVVDTKRERFSGDVYSLEVPGSHTAVLTGGLVAHNCFPKDTQALKQLAGNTGYHFQLLTSVIEVNELQKRRVISKLSKHLGSLIGKRVALLGLAFKPNTDDMREASSLVLAARLQGEGATVIAYDPVAEGPAEQLLPSVQLADSAADAIDGADAAILVTEWPEFAELDWEELAGRMSNPLIVDGRNFLDPERLRGAGYTYEGIGR